MTLYEKAVVTILGCDAILAGIAVPLALKKVPRNVVYGFRTPATLSDDRIWYEANAHFGRRLLVASIVGVLAILALFLAPLSPRGFLNASIVVLVAPTFVATAATLRYVRVLKRGEPSGGP
jgi:uncharacterized membrane protein